MKRIILMEGGWYNSPLDRSFRLSYIIDIKDKDCYNFDIC